MASLKMMKVAVFVIAMLLNILATSCFHDVVQEITVKSKFSKKYNCPRKEITIVEDELHGGGDTRKLVGCGVTAVYKGSEEIYVD